MAETGILAPDAQVELIEGEIVDVAPIGSRHSSTVNRLHQTLTLALGKRAIVQAQGPVRLLPWSEPQPDLAVLRARDDFYRDTHPTAADTLLVVEVSYSTLTYDRSIKVPLYARHGIAEAWLLDLKANRMHCFAQPRDGEYKQMSTVAALGTLSLAGLPEIPIDLGGIF
jgi:Uma2 family endonuclease